MWLERAESIFYLEFKKKNMSQILESVTFFLNSEFGKSRK